LDKADLFVVDIDIRRIQPNPQKVKEDRHSNFTPNQPASQPCPNRCPCMFQKLCEEHKSTPQIHPNHK
jgi:hypothetical protein